jgi:predicted DNA-binding protein
MPDRSNTRAARLPGELDRKVEQYVEQQGMTNSEALRHLIRAGLEAEVSDELRTRVDERFLRMAERFAWAAIVLLAAVLVGAVPMFDPLLPPVETTVVATLLVSFAASSVAVVWTGFASRMLDDEEGE